MGGDIKMETINIPNLVSEVKLTYKTKVKPSQMPIIKSSEDVFNVIKGSINIEDQNHIERLYILLLNRSNKVLGYSLISQGGTSGSVVDLKVIFQTVIKSNASGFILWHNHPSGNLNPSKADIDITKKVKKASKLLDVMLLDHLIIDSEHNYLSMADERII